MDRDEILELLEKEEGNKLEFKEMFNDSVLKTISADFELIDVDNKSILAIEVRKSYIPVSSEGRYYKRVGNTTR